MNNPFQWFSLSLIVLSTCSFAPIEEDPKMKSPAKILAERGLSSREMSDSVKQGKELFNMRCSTCHSLQLSTNHDDLLPSYWRATVPRMAAMANSGISGNETQPIYEYLVYFSATRRKRQLEEQLASLSEGERQSEQSAIDQVLRGSQ
jgi:hypothetical protein